VTRRPRARRWDRPAADWVARRAATTPDAEALVEAATGEAWNYADLDRVVAATAGRLWDLGLRPGDHLGTLLGTRRAAVVLVHAAARRGVVLVALGPDRSAESVGDQLFRADVTAVACEADTEALAVDAVTRVAGPAAPVVSVDEPDHSSVVWLERDPDPDRARGGSDPPDDGSPGWGGPTLAMFTSGTTGDPKAVVLTPGNLFASAVGSAFRLGVLPGDRWLCELPVHHVGGVAPFLRSTIYGTATVIQEGGDGFAPERTLDNLREYRPTGVSLVPTQFRRLLDAGRVPDSLRFVLLGGGPIPPDLVERCRRRGVPVRPTYGTTETASQVATTRPGEAGDHPGSVGPPLAFVAVTIVDEEGDPVPTGEVGEVVVDGPTVTPGYYGDPEATDAAFGDHGLYTGDLARRDDAGRLWIEGRVDDRIHTGGENVHSGTVENAIRSVEGVAEVAVVGIDDPEWGERVAALVVPDGEEHEHESDERLKAAITEACRERLADHEVPKTLAIADSLPLTASGTVEREAVRETIRVTEVE
jgi:O-succinylbenzoic acid--CoA ligase